MSEVSGGVRSVLTRPRVYELWSDLVGARRSRAELVRLYVRPREGDRILDLGCGPGELLGFLPRSVRYTGVDISAQYIAAARERFGDRAEFVVGDASGYAAGGRRFDLVIVFGVLHHLNDQQVTRLFATAAQVLTQTGRMMTVDPVYTVPQHPLARALIKRDRGQHVRDATGYTALARTAFTKVRETERSDLLRIPYSHCILECSSPGPGVA